MWYSPNKYQKDVIDINAELMNLKGTLDDKEAKITLAKFLRYNLAFTVNLLTGIELAPFQEITLRGMLNRNYSMCVWGRGCGKTFISSIFSIIQAIFHPNSKILIAGPTFRTAKFIFNKIEEIAESKNAVLLRQALGSNKVKRNDIHEWRLPNGSSIVAIPLNGEKIRGFRANILIIDEYLLMSREIIDTVLIPFLTAPQDIGERQKIIQAENDLIGRGLMTEEQRTKFENKTKIIALSSASYTFENLYVTYSDWLGKIYEEANKEIDAKYFVSQMSWDSIPKHMINKTVIEEAEGGGTSNAVFQREYCAQFTDGSEGYFSAKKMHKCTIPDGELPTIEIKGDSDAEYILAIDPSFSNAPNSDDFAMCLLKVDSEKKHGVLVHAYAEHGKDLKDHIKYFYYLYTHFNISLIVIDNAGYQFIDACNENKLFQEKGIDFKFIDFTSSKEGSDYEAEIRNLKSEYSKELHRIVYKQVFSSNNFIQKANDYLQGSIDYQRIWFASKGQAHGSAFDRLVNTRIDFENAKCSELIQTQGDFVEHIGYLVDLTKKECALIEVKSNSRGTQSFDLPQHLNRENGENRARRDSYTVLFMANWALKCYFDFKEVPQEEDLSFRPFFI